MSRKSHNNRYSAGEAVSNDALIGLLTDAISAEKAGVFKKTPVDPAALMAIGSDTAQLTCTADQHSTTQQTSTAQQTGTFSHWMLHHTRSVMSAAAAIAVTLGVASLWFDGSSPTPAYKTAMTPTDANDAVLDIGLFNTCFTGPTLAVSATGSLDGTSLNGECLAADFDHDGDVDFADFGLFQKVSGASRS